MTASRPGSERPGAPPPRATEEGALSVALELAVTRFHRLIMSIARRHDLQGADTDELMQEVRLRLWRSRGDPETLREVGASYVYRTAVTAALDLLRARRARRTGRDVVEPLTEVQVAAADDPQEALEEREAADLVYAAVSQLAESRRAVVRMHLAGYDREEIARTLGWTVGKVRNLLSRGLGDLRQSLASHHLDLGGDR